jgi:hypothetical protein
MEATATARSRLPWLLAALTVAILVASIPFLILAFGTPLPESAFGFRGWGLFLASAFLVAGQGIADRLAALGGELSVRSAPGHGTTLAGCVQVEVGS